MRSEGQGRPIPFLLIATGVLAGVAVASCAPRTARDLPPQGPLDTRVAVPTAASLRSSSGCRIDTRLYRPERPRTDALVVLGHGFLRDQGHMAGLAEALARAGIPTVTLDFCNSRLWDGRHVQNGRDMRRVADEIGGQRVVYAGFSAGGLSALVAAWDDPRAVGVLTLDLVDDGGLGAGLARTLATPLVRLQGEPAPCNAQSNVLTVFAASPKAQVLPIPGASHCDFESPTDWLCKSVCGGSDAATDGRRREVIARSVAIVTRLLGTEPQGAAVPPAQQRRLKLASERDPPELSLSLSHQGLGGPGSRPNTCR